MNKKLFLLLSVFIFLAGNIFAKDRAIVFFLETADELTQKTVQKIIASQNFSFAAKIDGSKEIPQHIQKLIEAGKLEPVVDFGAEPYFPIISSEIKINDSMSFDRTQDLKKMLSLYNEKMSAFYGKGKYGLFVDYFYANKDTFKYFNKYPVLWCAGKIQPNAKKGTFTDEAITVFSLHADFPSNYKNIEKWFSARKEKIIPVYLTRAHVKNEKLMEYLVNIFKNSKYTDVLMPRDAVELVQQNEKNYTAGEFDYADFALPQDILAKIALAAGQTDKQEDSALYENIYDEFLNMCSAPIINGIIQNDGRSLMLFDIAYSNIFKLSGSQVPSADLQTMCSDGSVLQLCSDENEFGFKQTDKGYLLKNSSGPLVSFSVNKTDKSVDFTVVASDEEIDTIDIYIDMNGLEDAGCGIMLKETEGFFAPNNYWEYSLRIIKDKASVYRFYIDDLTVVKNIFKKGTTVSVPAEVLKGNPYNWSYQVVASKENKIVDFLADEKLKEQIKNTRPFQIEMVKCVD